MQNGHLIEASTLKISAFLKNLICGRGFGSVFRHQIATPNRSRLGVFFVDRMHPCGLAIGCARLSAGVSVLFTAFDLQC